MTDNNKINEINKYDAPNKNTENCMAYKLYCCKMNGREHDITTARMNGKCV